MQSVSSVEPRGNLFDWLLKNFYDIIEYGIDGPIVLDGSEVQRDKNKIYFTSKLY